MRNDNEDGFGMRVKAVAAAALGAVLMAGCATTPPVGPVEVARYNTGTPLARGTIAVEPLPGGAPASLEYKTYAAAVETQLLQNGYTLPAPGTTSDFVATVSFTRASQAVLEPRSPVSVGLGAGGYSGGYTGGGVGLGGGISFPIGRRRPHDVILTELSVFIKKRADGGAIWEGHARFPADARAPEASASLAANRLAAAMFKGFPGESGRTIIVK